jgi:ribosome-binding ATPase YchF (GTP1/OBG family)
VIHTDFQRGFIKAEVVAFDDHCRRSMQAAGRRQVRIEAGTCSRRRT